MGNITETTYFEELKRINNGIFRHNTVSGCKGIFAYR